MYLNITFYGNDSLALKNNPNSCNFSKERHLGSESYSFSRVTAHIAADSMEIPK